MTLEMNDSVHMQYVLETDRQPYAVRLIAHTAIDCDDGDDYVSKETFKDILGERSDIDGFSVSELEDKIALNIHDGEVSKTLFLAVETNYNSGEVTNNLRYWKGDEEQLYFMDERGILYQDNFEPDDPVARVLEGISRDVYQVISLMEAEDTDDDDISPDDLE